MKMVPSSSFSISRALFHLCTLCLLSISSKAVPNYLDIDCPPATSYSPNSTYQENLKTLFSSLSANSNSSSGFYNFTAGRAVPDIAYGLFLCRGDVSTAVCQDCVSYAATDVVQRCPSSKVVTIWYDECMVRYSNQSFFSVWDPSYAVIAWSSQNVTGVDSVDVILALGDVLSDIATRASKDPSSGKKFATREYKFSSALSPLTMYALGQCTPDLTISDCNDCLRDRTRLANFPNCCFGYRGARFRFQSCNVRYEYDLFYNATADDSPPPLSPVLPPSSPPPGTANSPGKGGISYKLLIAIIVPIGISVLLFIIGFCFLRRKAKKKYDTLHQDMVKDEIINVKSLQYDLGTIQAATNNFSDDNKIGEGGFGPVYKGTLPNGEEIAVKRLSRSSGQGAVEFKNELVLVAKLQHKSLVRLLGFCLEGEEKILIYEFVPNKSLDYFLFDPQEQVKLDWPRRYKIIGGIVRGMLYLHEDSRLRIIHRDLKASNILLDGDMNTKVSDFGMARIFGVDQTQGNTSRVVGTFGYMSPEYVRHGEFSVKSDVFSFGVLVLEIISGKKNNRRFFQSDGAEDLLSYAWKLWRDETPLDLMDPTLEGSYSRNEVIRCIQIALLCVQEDPDERPSMATVGLMLNSYFVSLPLPQQPAFFTQSRTQSNPTKSQGSDQPTSKSNPLYSINEVSITELDPR